MPCAEDSGRRIQSSDALISSGFSTGASEPRLADSGFIPNSSRMLFIVDFATPQRAAH
jgi:hypothetical protein